MNLAIAAVLAENAMAKNFSTDTNIHISPEILVPRLGDYLVKKEILTSAKLEKALQIQQAASDQGNYILLGRILIQEGFIDQSILDTAITEQIALLQNALKKSNNELEDRVRARTVELRHALQKITRLNKLKTNFISNISHELRTPLAHMIGYLELIRDESLGPLTEEQIHALQVLMKSYNRLHNLIDDLLQFSMLSQGEMSLSQSTISSSMLLEKATSYAQNLAVEKDIELTINKSANDFKIVADQDKISWVLAELIENGIKFNRPGGRVNINVQADNGLVIFQISDNGIGISKNQLNEIYEPFHQLDGSSTRRFGGTGIGLTLVKQIIEAHGSNLKVDSIENAGTRFEFSLPRASN